MKRDKSRVTSQEWQVEDDKSRGNVESDVLKVKSLDKRLKTADWYINSNISRLTNQELPIKANISRVTCQEWLA